MTCVSDAELGDIVGREPVVLFLAVLSVPVMLVARVPLLEVDAATVWLELPIPCADSSGITAEEDITDELEAAVSPEGTDVSILVPEMSALVEDAVVIAV